MKEEETEEEEEEDEKEEELYIGDLLINFNINPQECGFHEGFLYLSSGF